MPDATPGLSAAPGIFVGRSAELEALGAAASLLRRGVPSDILVTGPAGMGRSALLRRASGLLADPREGLLAPLLEPGAGGLAELAVELARAVHAGGEPAPPLLDRDAWVRGEEGEAGSILRRLVAGEGDLALLRRLAEALAARTGRRLVVLLDDAHAVCPGTLPIPPLARGEDRVAWISAVPLPLPPRPHPAGPAHRVLALQPLAVEESAELLASSMARAGIPLQAGARSAARLLGGIPALVTGFAAAARLAGEQGFADADALVGFYAREISEGFLAERCRALLGGPSASLARPVIEVLVHLHERRGLPPEPCALAREMLREEREIAPALDWLLARGALRETDGRFEPVADPVLADWCRDRARRSFAGASAAESRARLVVAKRRLLAGAAAEDRRSANREAIGLLLAAGGGKSVPRSLLDFARFAEVSAAGGAVDASSIQGLDRTRFPLPPVVESWAEEFPGDDRVPAHRLDLLSLCAPDSRGRERMLAVDLLLGEREVTAEMIADFDRRCRLFLNHAGLEGPQLAAWVVSGGGFSVEALEEARRLRLWTSGPAQLSVLAAIAGPAEPLRLHLPAAETPGPEPYAFEMTIPARADTELVAARALEQVAEGLPLGEGRLGKLKMALVEACINAFEHGGGEERAVHLTFRVLVDRLEIDVFNRGRAFVPSAIGRPTVEEKFGTERKRGWGLSLIRDLTDELEFKEREEGTLLTMTVHFTTPRTGGAA